MATHTLLTCKRAHTHTHTHICSLHTQKTIHAIVFTGPRDHGIASEAYVRACMLARW